jgi:hypothetical protein
MGSPHAGQLPPVALFFEDVEAVSLDQQIAA